MAETIRHKILSALIAHIESESWVIAGDIPVHPAKTRYKPSELPGISVFARNEESEIGQYGTQVNSLTVELDYAGVISRDASDNKESIIDQIETIRGQLLKSLVTAALEDSEETELAESPVYTGGDVEYPTEEDMAFMTSVTGRIDYETDVIDPYVQ